MKTRFCFFILFTLALLIAQTATAQSNRSRAANRSNSAATSQNSTIGTNTTSSPSQIQTTRTSSRNAQQRTNRANTTRTARNRGRNNESNPNANPSSSSQPDANAASAAQSAPAASTPPPTEPAPSLVLTQPQPLQDPNQQPVSIFSFRKTLAQPDLDPPQSIYPDSSEVSDATEIPSYFLTQTTAKLLYKRGVYSLLHRDYATSERLFGQLTEIVPNSVYANFAYGLSLFLTDNYQQSIDSMAKSTELSVKKNIPIPKLRELKVNRRDFNYHFYKLSTYRQNFTGDPDAPVLLNFLTHL